MGSDLPLTEEDDSLVPDPNQTPSKSSLSFFTCSPLAFPLSNTSKSLKDMDKTSSSSSEANNNKENINSNNVEMPKLGIKPMQMKTRKKGSGYNLRKSLAWDRAFFTDEGILDPLELTLITGISATTLPTISEEGNTSCSSASRIRNESNDTKASKEALPKKLHDKSCTSKGNREKTGSSVGNHDSLPHHQVRQKVLTINRTNKPGSKVGGCSEPSVSSSSLKRPANSNILKTAHLESKLPKPNQLRHKLIPKPTINVQKNVGLKSSVKNLQGSQIIAKMGTTSIRSAQKTTNSSPKAACSTKSRLVDTNRTNNGSETVPDRLQLSGIQEKSALTSKNLAQHSATNSNNSLTEADKLHMKLYNTSVYPQNLYNSAVYPQNTQPVRPSGLRLPSPSLRFFDQKTAMEPSSLQQKKNQQCNSNLISNRKIGEMRSPSRTPMKINDTMENICYASSTHNTRGSAPSPNYMKNTTKGAPHSNAYPNLERINEARVDNKVCRASELESYTVIEQETNLNRITCKGPDDEIKVSDPTKQLEQGNGANIHLAGNNDERVPLVPETKEKFGLHNEVDRLENHTDLSMSTSREQSIEHTEKSDTESFDACKVNPESHLDAGRLEAEARVSKVFLEAQNDGIGRREDDVVLVPGLENYSVLLQHGQESDVDARCNNNNTYSGTKGSISITPRDSLKYEAGNGENSDGVKLKNIVTMMDTFCIPFQNMNTDQGNDDVDSLDVFSTRSPVETCHQSAKCLEDDPCVNASDDVFQEKSGQKQDVGLIPEQPLVEVEAQPEFREVSSLSDDHNHSSFSNLRPEAELISQTASVGNDELVETESVLQLADTYPHSLEKEATVDAAFKTHEQNQALEGFGSITSLSKTHVEVCLLDGDILAQSCSGLISELHNHSIQNVDHSDYAFEKQPEFSDTGIEMERVFKSEESCSFQREVAENVLEEKETLLGMFFDTEQVSADKDQVFMEESLCPEKIGKPNNSSWPVGPQPNLGEEVEAEVFQQGKSQMLDEFHLELDSGTDPKEEKDATVSINRSNNIKRQDNSLVIHPSNAVPFSDEWLSAIEAAGEEILTRKCGAVQHSPPDKSFPEPSPWSPVKKKANQIGPYDCTKYMNGMPSDPH